MAVFCPLVKFQEECKKDECGWFDTSTLQCGIAGIPEAIGLSR